MVGCHISHSSFAFKLKNEKIKTGVVIGPHTWQTQGWSKLWEQDIQDSNSVIALLFLSIHLLVFGFFLRQPLDTWDPRQPPEVEGVPELEITGKRKQLYLASSNLWVITENHDWFCLGPKVSFLGLLTADRGMDAVRDSPQGTHVPVAKSVVTMTDISRINLSGREDSKELRRNRSNQNNYKEIKLDVLQNSKDVHHSCLER